MASGSGEGKGDIPSVVLLELWGHVADDDDDDYRPDATTATSTTSTGLSISPSPTSPSTALVWRIWTPNPSDKFVAPTVISADADLLLLLRVPVDRLARFHHCFSDYFVYKVHPHSQGARLYRLPSRPSDRGFGDDNIAILSCGNDSSSFAVAYVEMEFSIANSSQDPGSSYYEWVATQQFRSWQLDILVDDGSWKVKTWSMPIPVTSWDGWKPGCSVTSNHLDTALHSYMRKID
uniref:DUF1618 domain-containing protein n=1 Tax=Oryza rufipogon TaxID=4529 RepID=A0A0E0PQT2_ORYRU